ncbi:RHS repeat-associated core domain protein-containing protein [Flavobacterium sp. CF136]|nr:RHS repeat-associated core domain-containing protein [Flavobacterium sp. CF136]EJL65544.1 RHS repeat-associated core domain protein-containing protein [Flavobacterium sp. CF136]
MDNLCYQYKYDNQNRLVEKKLPGKQWEFIIYDKLDRVVATGPANSPFNDITTVGWTITKYDAFNRPVITAWLPGQVTAATRKTLQETLNALTADFSETKIATATNTTVNGVSFRYSSVAWPTTGYHVLTVSYFDDYNYPDAPSIPATVANNDQPVYYNTTIKPKGLATATWTRILEASTAYRNELTYTLYDAKARLVRSFTQNFLGGYTYTDSRLDDFSGKLQYSITKHKRLAADTELTTKEAFTYSDQDRLLTQTHQINGGTIELIASNTYDELGRLISKKVGNTTLAPVQNIQYNYNIRGWLTAINDIGALTKSGDPKDLFAFKINYNTSSTAGVNALYNGNIAETYWTSNSEATPLVRGYGYTYDNLNRLKTSIFKRNNSVNNAYDENLTYDKNGNIMTLLRKGGSDVTATSIDDLIYSYSNNNITNQLVKVADTSNKTVGFVDSAANVNDDYSYDANGNMTKDNNKNIIEIRYNHLNLPTKITFASTENIVYIYNAAGQKVQKIVNETAKPAVTTDYLGGYQYNNNVLKFFPTAEGYVEPSGSSYKYVYQYKDHLGNIRLSYDKTFVIQEENNYYPFGLKQEGYNTIKNSTNDALRFKYNGKELQDELGLNMYDYGARNYDPALGRWMNIDPLAEKYYGINPYAYVFNNPIELFDPNGMEVKYVRQEGQTRKEFREMKREFKRENRQLMRDSKTHRDNFNQLKDSKNVHNITFSRSGGSVTETVGDINRNGGNGTNMNIDLSQKGSENEFVVAHEVGHGVDIDNGVDSPIEMSSVSLKDNPNDVIQKTFDTNNQNKEVNERSASHTENIVRGEVSNSRGVTVPLRETYTLEIQYISPFSGKAGVKNKTINVKNESYDYYQKK